MLVHLINVNVTLYDLLVVAAQGLQSLLYCCTKTVHRTCICISSALALAARNELTLADGLNCEKFDIALLHIKCLANRQYSIVLQTSEAAQYGGRGGCAKCG